VTTTGNGSRAARVGLATCAALPFGDADDEHLTRALADLGIEVEWIVWSETDAFTIANRTDLLVLRSTWDYVDRREEFLNWLNALTVSVHNPPDLVGWNSSKAYMLDLEAAGVPVVPTRILESVDERVIAPRGAREFVVKPAIGAGSRGAKRFYADDPEDVAQAERHARQLITAGSPAVVQPYLRSVDDGSETALLYFDGEFSHAAAKGPLLRRDTSAELVEGLYFAEDMTHRQATGAQRSVVERALAAVPGEMPLYARVDLIDNDDAAPVVLELELIEPSLFLAFDEHGAGRIAQAIGRRLTPEMRSR
jgi:glutathione synthase/RimK-type ligase-like ATP-grasp enzyme